MKRLGMSIAGVATAAVLVLGGGGVAHADSFEAQVDSLQSGVTQVDLGSLACGSGDEVSVDLFIARGGNAGNNTYKSSSTVTFSKVSQTAVTATAPTPGSVVIPSGWDELNPNSDAESGSATSKITVEAGNANGSFSGSVAYRASGTAADNSSLVKNLTVSVSWKVENCGSVPVDGTAPVVVLTCPEEPVLRGSTASAAWVATDSGGSLLAGASSGTIALDTSTYGDATATAPAGTAVDNAGNQSAAVTCGYFVTENTPPVLELTCPTEAVLLDSNANATWFATDEDGGSGLAGASSGTITLDTSKYGWAIATAPVGTARDVAGNQSAEDTCDYFVTEHTPPVVEFDDVGEFSCPAAPLILGSTAEVRWTAYDPQPGSGIAAGYPTSGSLSLDTGSVGSKAATVPAGTVRDNAGNESAAVDCTYSVVYDFDGFYRPVDMNGVVNSVKAGSAVPIKFSLDGDHGLDILAAGSPTITFTACKAGAAVDAVEETVTAGGSSLSYDPVADQYVYVWKTAKTWAGKCGTFTLTLDDGTAHSALFTFTK